MKYIELAELYSKLEKTPKKLEKRDILSEFYKKCKEDLDIIVLLSMGIVSEDDLGIAGEMMRRLIIKTYGIGEKDFMNKYKETGDMGLTAEYFSSHRKQITLLRKELTVRHVFDNLARLPSIEGAGSQENKMALVAELLSSAKPIEARYIVRTTLGEMRIGVAGGIVRDAIAKAFDHDAKKVEEVFNFIGNYGDVAALAKKGELGAEIEIGRPVRVMLADRAKGLEDALGKFEKSALEVKYDGFRVQIHKNGKEIKIFSRRMDNVTRQFPDIAEMSKKFIKADKCIIDGEALAIDIKTKKPMPFQSLSRRIQRKYDIDKMIKEIPVQVNLFDALYIEKNLMKEKLSKRWEELKEIIKETESFKLADHLETKDIKEAGKFYKRSLSMGEEGVIVKNLDASYLPGKRVGYWLKVKDILEPLDLVVTGARWGEGKRARWFGALELSAKSEKGFSTTAMLGSGLTDKIMEEMTQELKKLILREEGNRVEIKPKIVLEVGYEEIQKSPKYESGYALRFPKLLRIRTDKGIEDADILRTIEKLYIQQRGRKTNKNR